MGRWIAVVVVMATGCSPAQHRAYQTIAASVTSAGFVCDFGQTRRALADDPGISEGNPLFGQAPSVYVTGSASALGIATTVGITKLPRDRIPDWMVNTLLTVVGVVQLSVVANNAWLSKHGMTCGL